MIKIGLDSLLGAFDVASGQRGPAVSYYAPPAELMCAYFVFAGLALLYLTYKASRSDLEVKANSAELRRPGSRR